MAKKGKDCVAYASSGNGLDASTCSKQSQAFIEQQIALWGRVVKERKSAFTWLCASALRQHLLCLIRQGRQHAPKGFVVCIAKPGPQASLPLL